jgi:hypothetical protein
MVKAPFEGRQFEFLRDAIVASYHYEDLEQHLLFNMDRRLDEISVRDNLPNVAYRVLDTALREGWLEKLLCTFQNCIYPDVREVATRILDQYGSAPNGDTASPAQGVAAPRPAEAPGDGLAIPTRTSATWSGSGPSSTVPLCELTSRTCCPAAPAGS